MCSTFSARRWIHHSVVLWVTATHSHDSRPDAASGRYRNRSKNEEKVPSCSEEEIKQRPLTLIDKTEHLKAGKAYSSLLNGEGSWQQEAAAGHVHLHGDGEGSRPWRHEGQKRGELYACWVILISHLHLLIIPGQRKKKKTPCLIYESDHFKIWHEF